MKTKLFLSFLAVILIALVSNFIFRSLIEKDFEDYVEGTREDQLYWVMAAIEGSYEGGKWDNTMLSEAVHWGLMLGFNLRVLDTGGKELIQSADIVSGLGENMRRRMEAIINMTSLQGDFEEYPLFMRGKEIGALRVAEIRRWGNLAEKETTFKERGREFLVISFIIAGGGALFLSVVFSIFLTKPLMRLKAATEDIAKGDFGARVDVSSKDEIGELAKSFNFMSRALKKEDMIRRHLTSNIAHELRTPLSIMKANFEGIMDGVVECSKEQVRSLSEEVERLIKLVEGIEDITRAEAGFLKRGVMSAVNLRELMERHILQMKKIAGEKGIAIKSLLERDVDVVTDREKLDRIVKNLLTNAVKFTDGGEIAIDCGVAQDGFFITLSDTGRGMDTEEMGRIFDRFYKGKGSSGTGIGLSIVKELVQALDGNIDVQSVPGKGSRFTVFLPYGEVES